MTALVLGTRAKAPPIWLANEVTLTAEPPPWVATLAVSASPSVLKPNVSLVLPLYPVNESEEKLSYILSVDHAVMVLVEFAE
jgi:hypothetical protein